MGRIWRIGQEMRQVQVQQYCVSHLPNITYSAGSDVVYMKALGSHLLVLNSFEAARDLLDKKGALYSSRPRLVMINEL